MTPPAEPNEDRKKLALVDGSYYMFRAYHGMPSLSTGAGEPTGAIFGVINMLHKLLNEYQPDYLAVIFDAKGKSFRNRVYPDYKANRPPLPQELARQIAPIHELIKALGVPLLMIDDVEADDVIATLAIQARAQGLQTHISSGDKDLAQLVNDSVIMVNSLQDIVLDEAGVTNKYGVPPSAIVDYLALVGDNVDNVPGVPKVGPKTAVKWLQEYHSLQNLIDNAAAIKGKVGENLRANLEQLALSKQLVTLKNDVDLPYQPRELVRAAPDVETLRAAYTRWQFKSWLADLESRQLAPSPESPASPPSPVSPAPPESKPAPEARVTVTTNALADVDRSNYETILTESDLHRWLEKLERAELFSLDTETDSLAYMRARLVGVSFAVAPGEAAYVPLGHDYQGAPPQLPLLATLEKLRPLLEDPARRKVGHNLKYDSHVLANHGVRLAGVSDDTMLQSYVLNSTATARDMDSLALRHLNLKTLRYHDVVGKGSKQITFNHAHLEQASPYAAEDADVTLRLHQFFRPQLHQTAELQSVYETLEIPLLPALARIERHGVAIDADALASQSEELAAQMDALRRRAHEIVGRDFNVDSPKQLQEILYQELRYPVLEKTPKGQPSTSEAALQELSRDYPLPRLILEYRGLGKLKSTYTDKLPAQIDAASGRVHTSYHQAATSTGRLSSSHPNLQNIPVKTEIGRRIRRAFVAPRGWVLLAADYSQIELRIMAHLSQDPSFLDAFNHGRDVHALTASEVFGTQQISPAQRRVAKAINFGLIYGMSAFGLAKQLGITRKEAGQYVERYFARYPGVKAYMDDTRERAGARGYVKTIHGRRLYLPELSAASAVRRRAAERAAINAPMQGSAADIIKRAMIDVDAWINDHHPDVKLIMQVHDELVLEAPAEKEKLVTAAVVNIMSSAAQLSVPLTVNVGSGHDWEAAH